MVSMKVKELIAELSLYDPELIVGLAKVAYMDNDTFIEISAYIEKAENLAIERKKL